jgi:hypothetical protein
VIAGPVGPLEGHVASGIDVEYSARTVVAALVAGNAGAGDVGHRAVVRDLANDSNWGGTCVRVNERIPGRFGLAVGNDLGDSTVGGRGCNGSEQGSKDSERAHG